MNRYKWIQIEDENVKRLSHLGRTKEIQSRIGSGALLVGGRFGVLKTAGYDAEL